MGVVAKTASGLTAAGGFAGAAYGTYDYKTATAEYSIGLSSFYKFQFVEEGDDKEEQLKALISSYKSIPEDDRLKIPGLFLESDDQKNQQALFDKCKELRSISIRLKSEKTVLDLKDRIAYWCTTIKNVEEALFQRERRSIIIESERGDSRDDEWKQLVTSVSTKAGIQSFLGISKTPASEEHFSTLRSKCKEAFGKVPKDSDYLTSLENARNYCVRSFN